MEVRNGTKDQWKENRALIKKWFKDNPNSTITDCSRGTGISRVTVHKHIKDIKQGK